MKKLIFGILCIFIVGGVMSTCGCGNDSKPRTYVEAVSANDYVTAHAILDKYLQKAIDGNAQGYSFNYEYIEQFWGAADHIYKSEMMYLIEINDQAANKRLINTLAMMNIIGTKPLVNESYSKYTKEYSYYIFVSRYNLLCDEILNISFLNNNREMASQVLMMYKEDAILRKKLVDGCEYYTFTFSYKSKEAATKKYNDAIKNGLLN